MGWFDQEYKSEAIKTLLTRKKYEEALELADDTNWKRIRDVKLLCSVSDLYKRNRQYEKSRELLLMARKRNPEEKTILFALCEICMKLKNLDEAEQYYHEYVDLASEDYNSFVLKYKLTVENQGDLEEKITILEELKEKKYIAKWLYELAELYLADEKPDKCKEQCEELLEQFGDSKFAVKAEALIDRVG